MAHVRFEYTKYKDNELYTVINWLLGFSYALCIMFGLACIFSGGKGILYGILFILGAFVLAFAQARFNDWATKKEAKKLAEKRVKELICEMVQENTIEQIPDSNLQEIMNEEENSLDINKAIKCPNCGAELIADAMFCNKCGRKINTPVVTLDEVVTELPKEEEIQINVSENHKEEKTVEIDDNRIAAIRKWKVLYDEGIISKEEFEIKRKDILGL